MLKRYEVSILLKAGHPKAEVPRLSGVSLRSVNRIAQESPVPQVDDAMERAKVRIGRPSTVTNFQRLIVTICRKPPILRRGRFCGGRERRATQGQDRALWVGSLSSTQADQAVGPGRVTDPQSPRVTGASKARRFELYLMSWCSRAYFSASLSSDRASWICCIAFTR